MAAVDQDVFFRSKSNFGAVSFWVVEVRDRWEFRPGPKAMPVVIHMGHLDNAFHHSRWCGGQP